MRLLTEKTFPKKENNSTLSNLEPPRSSSPVRPNQSVSISDARRKQSSPSVRKESATKKLIVEEEIKPETTKETTPSKEKKDKKNKDKKQKNFDESLRQPLLSDKKKNKKEKKSKKKSKKGKKGGDKDEPKDNKCCSCF